MKFYLKSALCSFALIGFLGCTPRKFNTSATKEVKDVVSMQRTSNPGEYSAQCASGSTEIVTEWDIKNNNLCPHISIPQPSGIVSMQRRGDGRFDVLCAADIANSRVISAEDIVAGKACGNVAPGPNLKFKSISVGFDHVCALYADSVKCWGDNDFGKTIVPALNKPTQVSAGGNNTCALDADGVKCWGGDDAGQTIVPVLNKPTQVSAGALHTCALDADGVKCWGIKSAGEIRVPVLNKPTQVSAGAYHTCALDADGVKCWGANYNNNYGQTIVPVLNKPTQVSSGTYHTCALDAAGVKCWGSNDEGLTTVPVLNKPNQVSAGNYNTCALDADGVKCWGANDRGQSTVPQ